MKTVKVVIVILLILAIVGCNLKETTPYPTIVSTSAPQNTSVPIPTTETVDPTPSIEATKVTKVVYLTTLDEPIKKWLTEEGRVPIGNKVDSYYPKKEEGNWIFKDDYRQVTIIKNITVMKDKTTFDIYRQDGKSSKITVFTGAIVLLEFQAPGKRYFYTLFFAPSVNEFIFCHTEYVICESITRCNALLPGSAEYKGCMNDPMYTPVPCEKPCYLQPSSIRLMIGPDGKATKDFDENDSSWCTKNNPLVGTGFELSPYYSTFYVLPGDETVYHWSEGNCPKVTIEEIK
jgi:hypothetical protein